MTGEIKRLDWDSDFFRLNIARIDITSIADINYSDLTPYDLVYVFIKDDANEKKAHLELPAVFSLVDRKVTFIHRVFNHNIPYNPLIISYSASEEDNQIVSIGLQSGEYSRFKIDKRFSKGKFEELYSIWVNKSINRENADEVFVVKVSEKKYGGVITLKEKENYVEIGILAVDEIYRGKMFGKLLIDAAKAYCSDRGITYLKVNTQLANEKACQFYEKNGFTIEGITAVYHFWNKN